MGDDRSRRRQAAGRDRARPLRRVLRAAWSARSAKARASARAPGGRHRHARVDRGGPPQRGGAHRHRPVTPRSPAARPPVRRARAYGRRHAQRARPGDRRMDRPPAARGAGAAGAEPPGARADGRELGNDPGAVRTQVHRQTQGAVKISPRFRAAAPVLATFPAPLRRAAPGVAAARGRVAGCAVAQGVVRVPRVPTDPVRASPPGDRLPGYTLPYGTALRMINDCVSPVDLLRDLPELDPAP